MRNVTFLFLWLYVFAVPWDALVVPGLGGLSRLFGVLAIGFGLLTTLSTGRLRRPGAIVLLATAFTVSSAFSVLWTIDYGATVTRVWTYIQLLGSVWVMREFARTDEQRRSLLASFCVGSFVPLIDMLANFDPSRTNANPSARFSSTGAIYLNPDDMGLTLAIGIPIAWYLFQRTGKFRIVPAIFLTVAPLAILLTGTRSAFLVALLAVSIVPLTALRRISVRATGLIAALLITSGMLVVTVVPTSLWQRIGSIEDEVRDGSMSGRRDIWRAGWQVFPDRPVLGVGAGAFRPAVAPFLKISQVSHNVPLGLLVEQGVVGFSIFTALITACAWLIVRLPASERTFWLILLGCWLIAVMSVNWEYRKVTWMMIGLLAAREGELRRNGIADREEADSVMHAGLPSWQRT